MTQEKYTRTSVMFWKIGLAYSFVGIASIALISFAPTKAGSDILVLRQMLLGITKQVVMTNLAAKPSTTC